MKVKLAIDRKGDKLEEALEDGNRRASGRVRKLTAKAVALNGNRSYSPPTEDTIVIGETPPKSRQSSTKESPLAPSPTTNDPEEAQTRQETRATPAKPRDNGVQTPSPEELDPVEVLPSPIPEPTPSRRHSLREKKPTSKVLSDPPTTLKRPATEDPENTPARKAVRLSVSRVRVPSMLRYSVSSDSSEAQLTNEAEEPINLEAPILDVPAVRKSKIVVLKWKPQPTQSQPTIQPTTGHDSTVHKGKSRRVSERQKKATEEISNQTGPRPPLVDVAGSCNLSCLPPSSRLLAFAQIALQMPDEEDDEDFVPGGVYDWRRYTGPWCKCLQGPQTAEDSTDSDELARALMPNTVAQGTKRNIIDLTKSHTPESYSLSTPIQTILRAPEAEKLSKLYDPGNSTSSVPPNGQPRRAAKRPAHDLSAPYPGLIPPSQVISQSPDRYSPFQLTSSYPNRRTYEDRLRDDYNVLADVRERAEARGIPWSYNQTYDELQALLTQPVAREQPNQYRQQVINPPTVLGRAHEAAREPRPSPTGFGVLLPPKGSTFVQRTSIGPQQRNGSPAATSSTNGSSAPSSEPARRNKISFVEETAPSTNGKAGRPASPTRPPKSSRFRVDPRGVRGQAPGPGTIINMEEMKKKAEGLRRKGVAIREYEAKRKIVEDRKYAEHMARIEQSRKERELAEQKAKEAVGNGEA